VVVVDCAELTFIDCTTLGVLLEGQDRAARHGGDLVLRNCHGIVDQVLDALHLHGRLTRPVPPAPAGDRGRSVVVTPATRPRSMLW
jgi:anti-anti-sigma regulatory factor